jgi:hypothetical protein
MDPQIRSALGTVLAIALGGAGVWAVKVGIVPASDEANFVNMLVAVILGVAGVGLTWLKSQQVSPTAVIQQVNAQNNGVKVVPDSVPESVAPTVNTPLK